MEFRVNNYITLKLENNKTIICINGEKYSIRCGVLVNILGDDPLFSVESWQKSVGNHESIDFILDNRRYKSTLDDEIRKKVLPEEEFWAHCSNLQVWAENNYNTDLLDYHISFPLLDKLIQEGDQLAKDVYKQEILRRIKYGTGWAFGFFIHVGYLGMKYGYGLDRFSFLINKEVVQLTNEEIIEGTLNSDESEALMVLNNRTDLKYIIGISFGDDEIRQKVQDDHCPELFFTVDNGHIRELEIELTKELYSIPEELGTFKHLETLRIWIKDPNITILRPSFKIESVIWVEVKMHESVRFPQFLKLNFPNLEDQRLRFYRYRIRSLQ